MATIAVVEWDSNGEIEGTGGDEEASYVRSSEIAVEMGITNRQVFKNDERVGG